MNNISDKSEKSNVIIDLQTINIDSGVTGTCQCTENINIDLSTINVDRAISRSHANMGIDILNSKPEDAPLDSKIAALKTVRGKSELNGRIPNDMLSQFFREAHDTLTEEPKEMQWLLPGLWFKGMTWMLCGDPDVGKTTYILSQMYKLSRGEPVFAGSYIPPRPLKISYFVTDASKNVSSSINVNKLGMSWSGQENMQFISGHQIKELFSNKFGQIFSIGNENGRELLREIVKKNGSDILIIDTLGGGLTTEDENKPAEISPIMSAFRALAGELNIVLIIIHHFRKRGLDNKNKSAYRELEDVAGSKSIYGQCDSVLSIEKRFDDFGKQIPRSGIVRVLKTGAAGGVKVFPEIHFDILNPTETSVVIDDKIATIDDTDDKDKIRSLVLNAIQSGTNTFRYLFVELQNKKGMNKRLLEREITAAKTDGHLITIGHSRNTRYKVTELGLEYIKAYEVESIPLISNTEEIDKEFDLSYNVEDKFKDLKLKLEEESTELINWDLSINNKPEFVDLSNEEDTDFLDYVETLNHITDGKKVHNEIDDKLHDLSWYHKIEKDTCNARIVSLRDKSNRVTNTDWHTRCKIWNKEIDNWFESIKTVDGVSI